MRVQIGDEHHLVIHSDIWKIRLVGVFFFIFGAALLWHASSDIPLLVRSLLWLSGAISVAIGACAMLGPLVRRVCIQRKNGQVSVYWRSLLRGSVEQVPSGEVSSIDIGEDANEEGTKIYSLHMGLKNGRRLVLASGLKQKPVVPAFQIKRALNLTDDQGC